MSVDREQVRQEIADAWFRQTGKQMVVISDSYLDMVLTERSKRELSGEPHQRR